METKRLITLMLVSFVVIFGWQLLVYKFLPPPKPPAGRGVSKQRESVRPRHRLGPTRG